MKCLTNRKTDDEDEFEIRKGDVLQVNWLGTGNFFIWVENITRSWNVKNYYRKDAFILPTKSQEEKFMADFEIIERKFPITGVTFKPVFFFRLRQEIFPFLISYIEKEILRAVLWAGICKFFHENVSLGKEKR